MIEGTKVLFFRIMRSACVFVFMMPIWNVVYYQYFIPWHLSNPTLTFCVDSVDSIVDGVGMVPFLAMASIGIAFFHVYYRGAHQRQFESQYQQMAAQEGPIAYGYLK